MNTEKIENEIEVEDVSAEPLDLSSAPQFNFKNIIGKKIGMTHYSLMKGTFFLQR